MSGHSFISQNPFRVISVLSNSGAKEIKKNLSKIKAFTKIGKSPSFQYDFNFLNLAQINRSEDVVSRIENKLLLDESKIKNSLFWFINITPIDSVALNNLSEGNIDKAIDIWTKSIKGKEISDKNFSSLNNLSSLQFLKSLDSTKSDQFLKGETATMDLRSAISKKYSLLDSKYFNNYCECVLKNTSQIDNVKIKSFITNLLIELLSVNYSNKELSDLFNGLDEDLSKNLSENLIDEPIRKILSLIKNANDESEKDHKLGIEIGKKLIKDCFKYVKQIKEIVGEEDYQYQTIANKLSNQIMQCGILCFNKTKNDSEYLSSYKYAFTIACDTKTMKRATDCIKHCEEEKNAKICNFCNLDEVTPNSSFKVKMHMMNFDGSYDYFKDGGIKVTCCKSCVSGIRLKKHGSAILGFLIYVAIAAISYGLLFYIDLIFARLSIFKWFNKLMIKQMFYNKVKHHPTLSLLEIEGYEYGMP